MENNIIESNLLPLKDGSGLIDAEFHKSVGPEHAASVAEQVVSSEEFFANNTRLSDLGAQQVGTEITPTAADPVGLRTGPFDIEEVRKHIVNLKSTGIIPGQNHPGLLPDSNGNMTLLEELEEFFAEGTTPLADTSIKIDGDRTQLTETQMAGVVENVFDQTLNENIDFFSPAIQIGALQERVYALETFNAKLLLALKQHGFDTNKLFR